ncbi:MAG: methionine synthase [Phycisphaerales bacterium JB043]
MPSPILSILGARPFIFDGAMGTSLHACDCDIDRDYLGKENCVEVLTHTRPEMIQEIHESFLRAGADAVETNTFGGAAHVLNEFDIADQTRQINRDAALVARKACEAHTTPDKPRFVIGSMGPGTKLLTLGQIAWHDMLASYTEQARGLLDGGVDALCVETCQDILQTKCAVIACLDALEESGKTHDDVPIFANVTIETTGTMLVGSEIAAAAQALENFPIVALGLNCGTGPDLMVNHLRWLSQHWPRHLMCMPNAGLPELVDGQAAFPLQPTPFAEQMEQFVCELGVAIVGGCCGTTPEHIAQLSQRIATLEIPSRPDASIKPGCSSLYSPVEYHQDASFLIIGERTNSNGSRKFKRLLNEGDWDQLITVAREQVRDGSHVIDVCVDEVGRDGVEDMTTLLHHYAQHVTVPIMIDSTDPRVMEAGLQSAPGKCIINSMNLEDGEEKLAHICRLARRFGAAVVAGTIDDDPEEAMGKTADRKLAIAQRIYDLAVNTHGIEPHDIFFDPLVLPITTGVEADRRLGLETVEGIRRIHESMPECQITVGLSNVSFGLSPQARVVLNSVFLYECLQAGLTSAIVHASKILPKNRIPQEQWDAAIELLYDKRREDHDPLTRFIELFDGQDHAIDDGPSIEDLPLDDRLRRHIIDGEKQHLTDTLDEALTQYDALTIINDHLLEGMKTVGDLFGRGEMQLPFVLQSASVMKASVAHLEPHIPATDAARNKGSIVLATVKGDVHDIGKNLVDIILSNNGYNVINLGIKQPIADILSALEEHKADAIGLSGLLVKSVAVMRENLVEMADKRYQVPVLLGGAALNRYYCESELREVYASGKAYYGRDAFEALSLMDHISKGKTADLEQAIEQRLTKRAQVDATIAKDEASDVATATETTERSSVATDTDVPAPPFWGTQVVDTLDLDTIFPFINTIALFRGQWQFKRGPRSDDEYNTFVSETVHPIFHRLQQQCRDDRILRPKLVYGYFPVQSDGNDLIVFDPDNHDLEIERFTFPRQQQRRRLCIADFFKPVESGQKDVLALQCVTVGQEATERCRELFESDDYTEYLYLHGIAVETAEALAELWHKRVREELDIHHDDHESMRKIFAQHYRGSRYSFGYPACPNMQDQEILFRLLQPERIGCALTENWQIDPEQSTSAIVVHHPEAKYFNV